MLAFLSLMAGIVLGWHCRAIIADEERADAERLRQYDADMRDTWQDAVRKLERAKVEQN